MSLPEDAGAAIWTEDGWYRRARWVCSPNYGERPPATEISLIVLHNISLPPGEYGGDAVERFFCNALDASLHPYFETIAGLAVSAHFFIRRDGEIVQFVASTSRAWHAGQSNWQGRANCNDFSLGIELEGCDDEAYCPAQYEALWQLIAALQVRHPVDAVAGHCHIAPGRKTDPGPVFDWASLAQRFPGLRLPAEVTA